MTQIKLYFIAFALVSCNVSPKKNINQVDPPWGYVYDDWEGPPLDVITYIPPKASVDTPVLMVIPGASRDAQRFHGSWLDLAKRHHFSVVTVGAKKSFFPDEHSYNAGNVFDIKGNLLEKDKWLFSALEPIFYDFKNRYGFKANKFYLFGHSAGGGFVHRYMLLMPEAPIHKAVAANPAFVTLPDQSIAYPFGLKNIDIDNNNIANWFSKDMAIVLGEDDLGPRTKPLSNGPMARAQGPNCFVRGQRLYQEAFTKAKEIETEFGWSLITVPGVGHDNYNLAPHACKYLFEVAK